MTDMTPDQGRIRDAAIALHDALMSVPSSTADYRVEQVRRALELLMPNIQDIVTDDVKNARDDRLADTNCADCGHRLNIHSSQGCTLSDGERTCPCVSMAFWQDEEEA
jgi:hypothetical protein